MGYVTERGKGNWYAIISTKQAGKRKVKFISLPDAKNKTEAKVHLARITTEINTGSFIEPNKTTVEQFLQRWLDHVKTQVEPRTHESYAGKVALLNAGLGSIPLSKLKPEHVSAAYSAALAGGRRDGKQGGLSPRTVHHMHRVLIRALRQALRWGTINRNVAALVDPPKYDRREMKILDVDQATTMIEALRGETILFIPVLLGLLCGLRRSEICAIRWRNVDLDRGQLSVVNSIEESCSGMREKSPKNGKGRTVALPPMLTPNCAGIVYSKQNGS